jgi:hypothetical protein
MLLTFQTGMTVIFIERIIFLLARGIFFLFNPKIKMNGFQLFPFRSSQFSADLIFTGYTRLGILISLGWSVISTAISMLHI